MLMLPPIPTPPDVTISAPVLVLVLVLALFTVTFCPNTPYTLLMTPLDVIVPAACMKVLL